MRPGAENSHWASYGMRYTMFFIFIYLVLHDGTNTASKESRMSPVGDQGLAQVVYPADPLFEEKRKWYEGRLRDELLKGGDGDVGGSSGGDSALLQWIQFTDRQRMDATLRFSTLGEIATSVAVSLKEASVSEMEKVCCGINVGLEVMANSRFCVVSERIWRGISLASPLPRAVSNTTPSLTGCQYYVNATSGGGEWIDFNMLLQTSLNLLPIATTSTGTSRLDTYLTNANTVYTSGNKIRSSTETSTTLTTESVRVGVIGPVMTHPTSSKGGGVSGASSGVVNTRDLLPTGMSGMWYRDADADVGGTMRRMDELIHTAVIGLWNLTSSTTSSSTTNALNASTSMLHQLKSLAAYRTALAATQELKYLLLPHIMGSMGEVYARKKNSHVTPTSTSKFWGKGPLSSSSTMKKSSTSSSPMQQPVAGSFLMKGASVVSGGLIYGTVFGDGHGAWDWWPLTLLWDSSPPTDADDDSPSPLLSSASTNSTATSLLLPAAGPSSPSPSPSSSRVGDVVLESISRDGVYLQSSIAATKWRGIKVGSGLLDASRSSLSTTMSWDSNSQYTQWVIAGFPQGKTGRDKLFGNVANSAGVRRDRRAPYKQRRDTLAATPNLTASQYHGAEMVLTNALLVPHSLGSAQSTPPFSAVVLLPRYPVNQIPTADESGKAGSALPSVVSLENTLSDQFKKVMNVVYDAKIDAEDIMGGIPSSSSPSHNSDARHVEHRLDNMLDLFVRTTLFSYFQLLATPEGSNAARSPSLIKTPVLGADLDVPANISKTFIPYFSQEAATAQMHFTADGSILSPTDTMFGRPCMWLGNIVPTSSLSNTNQPQRGTSDEVEGLHRGLLLSSCGDQVRILTSTASFLSYMDAAWSSQCLLIFLELLLTYGIVSMRWVRNSRARQLRVSVWQLLYIISMQFVLNTILEVMGLVAAPTVRLSKILWLVTMINSNLTAFILFDVYRGHTDQDTANYQAQHGQLTAAETRRRFFGSQAQLFCMFMLAVIVPQVAGLLLQAKIASPWVIALIGPMWWMPQMLYLLRGKAGVRENAGKGFTVPMIISYGAFGVVTLSMFITNAPYGGNSSDTRSNSGSGRDEWTRHFHDITSGLVLPSSTPAVIAANISILFIVAETVLLLALRIFNIPLSLPYWLTGARRHIYDVEQLTSAAHLAQIHASQNGWAAKLLVKLDAAYPSNPPPSTSQTTTSATTTQQVKRPAWIRLLRSFIARLGGIPEGGPHHLDPIEVMRKLSQGALEDEECIICTVPLAEDVDYDEEGGSGNDGGGGDGHAATSLQNGEGASPHHQHHHQTPHAVIEMGHREEGEGITSSPEPPQCPPSTSTLPPLWVTPCGHFFHKQCLVTWMEEKLTCPLCRMPLPEP